MQIELINLGYFYADGGAMFGAIPKILWSKLYPSDDQNRCVLAMRAGLIKTNCGRIILVDNGMGNKHKEELEKSHYHPFDTIDLLQVLSDRGISPSDVTDVVLTHLHFDHCGYTTIYDCEKKIVPTFPNATCWVSQYQWDTAEHPHPLEAESFSQKDMNVIKERGLLRLIANDSSICNGVSLRLFNGHTFGQIVPYVEASQSTVVFAGDVVPLSSHLSPEWISAYDIEPLKTYNERVRLLDEANEKKQIVVYYHDIYTSASTVKKVKGSFKVGHKISF